ncbi:twin-arginine translocase TatA/TatE family subunit [bacterium]|nr:twin-arginine translocase TatA/TatE family subunit [bacterium]
MRAGFWEIVLIVVLVLILFGHNKIPGLMKNLANGINVFKKEIKDTKDGARAAVQKGAVAHEKRMAAKKKAAAPKK